MNAAANVQKFIGGIKKPEDVQKSEKQESPLDSVRIDAKNVPEKTSAARGMEEAARSGVLSEQEEIRKKEKEITGDIPPEALEAAKKIVKGRIHKMKDMVPIPEDLMVSLKPEDFHGIMGIHDWHNQPIYEDEPGN